MATRVRGFVQARPDRCTCDEPAKGNDVSGPCLFVHHTNHSLCGRDLSKDAPVDGCTCRPCTLRRPR